MVKMTKGMDVEVIKWQPPSTSKVVSNKSKCPPSIWLIMLTQQRLKFGTDSQREKKRRLN
jgi:hypothetical protein